MSLSCSCSDWDGDGLGWILAEKIITRGEGKIPAEIEYFFPLETKRARKCCSCGELIKVGDLALKFKRFRSATKFEADRLGWDEVSMAPWFMCESCGEIFLNLEAAGFCLDITESMAELMEEYREIAVA